MTKQLLACSLGLGLVVFAPGASAQADSPTDVKDAELRRKTEEVETLRRELDRQEQALKELRQENARLRKQKTPAPLPHVARESAPKPVTPIASMPPLEPGVVLEAADLAGQFASERSAADSRYAGQVVTVRGDVVRFSRGMVSRDYSIALAGHDLTAAVVCQFRYSDAYRSVYPRGSGRELVARTATRAEIPLAHIGQNLVIRGKCKGVKDGDVILTGCEVTR